MGDDSVEIRETKMEMGKIDFEVKFDKVWSIK